MNKKEFAAWCEEGIHILDGATGSNLQRKGMGADVCPEAWILENPEKLIELQKEYIEAGSDVVYAPTFGANRIKLKKYGLEDRVEEINKKLVAISKEATEGKALVVGDMTMCGEAVEPIGTLTMSELIAVYKEQAQALANAEVDFIVVETMMSLQEVRAAVLAIKEVCDLPIMVTMTFENNGRTLYGTDPATAVLCLQAMGVDAFGANCGAGPDKVKDVIEKIAEYAQIPIVIKPNAGLPKADGNGNVVYDMEPQEFAEKMKELVSVGAGFIGGCCGTAPEYIKAISVLKNVGSGLNKYSTEHVMAVTSERGFTIIDEFDYPESIKIAELPDALEDIEDEIFDEIIDAVESKMDESDIVILNLDNIGADAVVKIVNEASQIPGVFLGFEASDGEALIAALRTYPGVTVCVNTSEYNHIGIAPDEIYKYGAVIYS